ncbi:MAG: DNA primase, partial [Anaerolineales bacterium]|nr:DNA primase [Anaerolineales bacterium]
DGLDFKEALRVLSARAGVELPEREAGESADEETHARLRSLLEAASAYYRHHLTATAAGAPVLAYLQGRGLEISALESFEVGYAPPGWTTTMDFLSEKRFSLQDMAEAGLVSEGSGGIQHDRFRNRIMLPIRDGRGRLAGFGARIVDPSDVPKFLNSPQTALFDKGRLLYGLDKARKAIRTSGQAVLVEGYLDVIALHQAGQANVVSPMGTALTEAQLRLLKRHTRRIVLALDADAAGYQATLRGLEVARQAMGREMDPVFEARGLVRFEGRLDADVRVVTLPAGLDPDELVARGSEAWENLVKASQPIVEYVLDVVTQGKDLEDPKVKSEIAKTLLPLIEDVADPVEREAYRQSLARRIKVDERALAGSAPRAGSPGRGKAARRQPSQPASDADSRSRSAVEQFCLGLILRDPEMLYALDRVLQELGLERISGADFTGTQRQVIFQAAREGLAQDQVEPAQYWSARLEPELQAEAADMLERLESIGQMVSLDPQLRKVADEILARFLQLRKQRLDTALGQAQFQLLEAQSGGPPAGEAESLVSGVVGEVQRLAEQKSRVEQAMGGRSGDIGYLALSGRR